MLFEFSRKSWKMKIYFLHNGTYGNALEPLYRKIYFHFFTLILIFNFLILKDQSLKFILPFFSAPEPKAQVHYWDHALSVVRRPSVVNFSHFRLLLWNRWTEFNETWREARSQRPLPSLCFAGGSEKQDGCPGLWLAETFSTSLLKPLNGI